MMIRLLPLLIALTIVLAGCGPQGGLLIRPVRATKKLTETTVAGDKGWFVRRKIVLVDVSGTIVNEPRRTLLGGGENPVSLFVEKVDKARRDDQVVGLILRINSPGGSVTASDIMHNEIQRFRRKRPDVPVVALIEGTGASGAYYLAVSAEEIYAHPTSVTGSIGVIVPAFSVAGTMDKLGITAEMITSGPFKDMASPFEPLEAEDLAILQTIVNEFYEAFVTVVARGRPNLSNEEIRRIADGRVYTGQQAVDLGLVDKLGTIHDIIDSIKERTDGDQRVKVVMYHRPLGYRGSVYAEPPALPQVNLINIEAPDLWEMMSPRFMYLWTGRR
ncbi:MAG: signal peptide peptidase SppA [Planctomycetota bacterium]